MFLRGKLGQGPLRPGLGGFAIPSSGYSTEAEALFARMTIQPDAARKTLIDNFFKSGKQGGWLAKLDFLFMLAAHSSQAARVNWLAANEITPFAAPIFTVDRGFKGDGASSYMTLPYSQTDLPKARLALDNDASWLAGVRQAGTPSRFILGAGTSIRFTISASADGVSVALRNGQGVTSDSFTAPQTGRFGSTRSGATAHEGFRNGISIGSSVTPSATAATTFILLFRGGTTYSDAEVTHYAVGAGLTPQEHAAADAAFATYLQAVGAF